MKTVEEIKEELKDTLEEWKELTEVNTCHSGMLMGRIDTLRWVLEDSEDDTTINK